MVEPSKELQAVFDKAIKDARRLKHEYVTLEHLLFAMMCSENFYNLCKGFGADVDFLKSNLEHHVKNDMNVSRETLPIFCAIRWGLLTA